MTKQKNTSHHVAPPEDVWHRLRAGNISSTESAALFGLSPYLTEFELYQYKKNGVEHQFEENFRIRCGKLIEPAIAQLALDELKCNGREFKDYIVREYVCMGSSFDWEITSGPFEGWLLECKNVDYLEYKAKWEDDEAPIHIEIQVQHQMHVAERPGVVIACLVGGNDLKLIYRARDEEFGQSIEDRVADFWSRDEEPEPDFERDAEIIKQIYNFTDKDEVYDAMDNEEMKLMLTEYNKAGKEIKRLEGLRSSIKAEIFRTAGTASKVLCDNFSVDCGMTKESPAEIVKVTKDMIGMEFKINNGRKAFRQFRVTEKKDD